MAVTYTEIRFKVFVALFLAMCDGLHLEYSATRVMSQNPKHPAPLLTQDNENVDNKTAMGENTILSSQRPKEDYKFFIHLEIRSSSTNNSSCFILKANEKNSTGCSITDNSANLEIQNSIDIFCLEDENFKYQAHIEGSTNSSRCESIDIGDNHQVRARNTTKTFTNEFLQRVCGNIELSNFTKMDNYENSTCLASSESYNRQCCIESFHFIPRGAIEIESVMSWMDEHGYSYSIALCFAMSFVCILIIFLSGIVSKNYRSERGNQILIHFAFSIFAQIILHMIACFIDISPNLCYIQSLLFHYITLVESCWTSIIAYLQYKRFVKVFDNEPNHLIFKLCAIAYVLPMFPLSLWIIYHESDIELVNYLTFALPELLILLINSTFLILITRNIVFVKNEYIEHKKSLSMEVKLIFFLFFVLDFSWFQIILSHLTSNKFFIYLFLFTQSMQGFMLFFVFGIMNEHNRYIYKKFFVICLKKLL